MLFLRSTFLALAVTMAFFNTAKADSIPRKPRLALQISPLALVDVYSGSNYKIGTTIRLTESFFFSADFGGYFKNFTMFRNNKGFVSDFRIRYQFPDSYSGISINYFYKQQAFDYHDSFKSNPGVPITVHTQKYINCLNVNYEHWFPFLINERAYFTLIVGAGIRFRNVISTLQTKKEFYDLEEAGDSPAFLMNMFPGNTPRLNANIGLRLGFYLF